MIKKKTILTTGLNIVAVTSVATFVVSCGSPAENLTSKENNLNVSLVSKELSLVDGNYNLELNVGSENIGKYLDVELRSQPTESSPSTISTKAKVSSEGIASIPFSHLDEGATYYVTKVNIYNDENDTKPSLSRDYLSNNLEQLQFRTLENQSATTPSPSPTPGGGDNHLQTPNFNQADIIAHIKKLTEEKERKANYRPASKENKSLQITEQDAYKKLENRSFAIGFNSIDYVKDPNDGDKINTSVVPFEPTGTGWLLDYAWKNGIRDSDELMLYIATNAHVYARAFNAMDEKYKIKFPEYFTQDEQKQAKIDSFSLAIPKQNANLNAIASGTSYGTENSLIYFLNTQKNSVFDLDKANKELHFVGKDLFSNPRTVFVALNIFDNDDNNKLIDQYNNQANRKLIGKDFAVFGIKVQYKKLMEKATSDNNLKLLLEHIKKAMSSIDNDIDKFKKNQYYNHDQNDVPYLSFDYPSAWADKNKGKEDPNVSLNIERAYILGFPTVSNRQMLWRNYPLGSNIPQDVFNGASFFKGLPIDKPLDQNTKASGFGFNAYVDYSSLYFGASGSLVINEYGLPIGIYSTVRSNGDDKNINNQGGFTFLVQVRDDNEKGPAHNLIDGTDKVKFPKQEKSYRQNLKWLSEQDNSEFKDFAKTAIFKSGA
ncbi:MIP family Ig-specific serine endopeptidase [Mesomycoplasma bovoculi]|uniref:Putative lipoprotein n=1 Tax=Mesomycoplasma bovoculi M165/69 TaxID=743966 RepID=W5USA6_9BACT|nr:DUF31 family protein [Mesomycoplasma bovoculi]AHH45109.1 putative lipoprotein [Mesomycoplasma bovoculi M165/69]